MVTHAVKTISAARHGDVEGLRRLNMSGVDVDAKDSLGWSALHRASMHGQLDAMRVLVLECGAAVDNVDEDGWTAAHRAAWSGQLESLRCLVLELGADPIAGCAAHGESAIHVATRNGQIDALRCLVTELGVDVETADNDGSPEQHPLPPPPPPGDAPLSPKERARRRHGRAARRRAPAGRREARGLAAHLVAVHGAASFDELLDPDIFDDLDVLAPYGLLPVPLKKLKKRQRAWASSGSARSPLKGSSRASASSRRRSPPRSRRP
ncbi:hypothetical protein JL720_12564 [Aureococcus anophagefferens]|nr:hypothetical protein JL720_12564 [Aureococcus anophagefferens]